MTERDPAVLLSVTGPAGAIDVAALTSMTPRRLADELAPVIGAVVGPLGADLVRTGGAPCPIPADVPLGEVGALDGDTLRIGASGE